MFVMILINKFFKDFVNFYSTCYCSIQVFLNFSHRSTQQETMFVKLEVVSSEKKLIKSYKIEK
jgi:hypothetical protein